MPRIVPIKVKLVIIIDWTYDARKITLGKPYLYGYRNPENNIFWLFNECITEMLNIEILDSCEARRAKARSFTTDLCLVC